MYVVRTIGALPPGPPPQLQPGDSLDAPVIALVALSGVLAGALGVWALERFAPRRKRR